MDDGRTGDFRLTKRTGEGKEESPQDHTFVIRFWPAGSGVPHGEIRHVPTGSEMRFRHMRDALDFMGRFVPLEEAFKPMGAATGLR